MIRTVHRAGYTAELPTVDISRQAAQREALEEEQHRRVERGLWVRFDAGAVVAFPVVTFSVGEEHLSSRDGLLFGLAVIVFLLGSPPLLVGVRSRLHNISMNGVSRTLISSFAALILSLANISTGWTGTYRGVSSALFQDSAVIVLLIGLLGHTLERHTRGKCCRINRVLYKLVPEKATVRRDGEETRIPLHELRERESGYIAQG